MTANLDRFQGAEPVAAIEAGDCGGCGGVMYEYDVVICPNKSHAAEVHKDCVGKCDGCGSDGCRACLIQDPDSGDRLCEDCREGERP